MAGIGHINSTYNPDLKRLSSKLAFQIGERFTARVVKFDESAGEILLKLLDGWNFSAKLDKPLDFSPKGKLKFQIVGMEDGKVIIRLLQGDSSASKAELDSLVDILNQNNLGEEGYDILEKMLKHEIPLNKENISKVKSISDFLQKINVDPVEEDAFIGKYIASKAIDENSEEGQFIKTKLKEFFSELKSIDMDDVLTMLENDIDLNTENIESFKRIFKNEGGLYKTLKSVDDLIKSQFPKEITSSLGESTPLEKDVLSNMKGIQGDDLEPGSLDENINSKEISKDIDGYSNMNSSNKKLDKLDILKTLLNENSDMDTILNEMDLKGNIDIDANELDHIDKFSKSYNENELKELLNSESNEPLKRELKEILVAKGMLLGDEEPLEGDTFANIKDVQGEDSKTESVDKNINDRKELNNIDAYKNLSTSNKKLNKLDILKTILNENLDKNTIVKEFDLNTNADIDGAELGDIEKLIKSYNKDELKEVLVSKGIIKGNEEQVQSVIKDKSNELKEVIKNILSLKTGSEKEVFDRVLDFMKPTINDIKLFNTVNNQYYYMDIPLNFKEQEYPCKLIIKDERSRGKRIDSKNVSMVVSIKTVNLGDVDSYIKVKENNMSINIKCQEKWIKSLEDTKDKLVNSLNNLGYNLFINFEKREETVDITTTRNFFNDNGFNNINVKV